MKKGYRTLRVKLHQVGLTTYVAYASLILSFTLCFVPLFNILAFEFAFVSGLFISLLLGVSSASAARALKLTTLECWQRLSIKSVGPCVMLLLPICINGFFVQNCNWLDGIMWFSLLVLFTALVSTGIGTACGLLSKRGPTVFLCVWALVLLSSLARFYWTPQVDLFSFFGGYFPGALYDEVIEEQGRVFWSRVEDLSITWLILTSIAYFRRELSLRNLVVAIIIFSTAHFQANQNELRRPAELVQQRLGGVTRTQHFVIYHPRQWNQQRTRTLAAELEFLFTELSDQLQLKPTQQFDIYFYQSMNQKKRLMGARNTRIAKPWQFSFHVDAPYVGDSVLRHELIHLFAAEIGEAPLNIASNRMGLPNMALTEGLAEAYSPRDQRLSLHEWTAALEQIGKRPDVSELLRPDGFYRSSARTAYTTCGSLIRFAQEQHGLDPVKSWYRRGQWSGPVSVETLLNNWRNFLTKVSLDPRSITAARAYFDRPSIFKRVCAHEISSLRDEIRKASRQLDYPRALALMNTLLTFSPNDRWTLMRRLEHYSIQNDLTKARAEAERLSTHSSIGQMSRNLAMEWLADLNVMSGDFDSAQKAYRQLLNEAFNRARIRRLEIKLIAAKRPDSARAMIKFLSFSRDRMAAKHSIQSLQRSFPNDESIQYLRARQLFGANQDLSAYAILVRLRTAELSSSIQLEIQRLMSVIEFRNQCYETAEDSYGRLIRLFEPQLTQGELEHFQTWQKRSRFFSKSEHLETFSCPLEIDNHSKPHHDVHHQE